MPKSLKAHSGERLDLVDLTLASNTYTQEMQKFLIAKALLDKRSRILDGFRVKIEDQTINPGLITVYNGVASDALGQTLNNEDQANDSRSVLLSGTGTFYVEVEFREVDSDVDARYFWDPTTVNTAPNPDGSEFSLNVATRIAPDWRVVTPVSTTGFEQTAAPNSTKIPVGVFTVAPAVGIVSGVDNPGLVLVSPSSVLITDSPASSSILNVADARMYPTAPFTVTLDLGSGVVETPLTVTYCDMVNNRLTLSAPTSSAHPAGAIVRYTGTASLVANNADPSDATLDPLLVPPGHPDPAQRLWQANEVRGSGLMQSRESYGARSDLNLSNLKDELDFMAAQIREMKFGHPRPDTTSYAPPPSFASRPRYFDRTGSIQGSRSYTVSIGNGTTSFGDFNGTSEVAFAAAVSALPVTGGSIYVGAGTYTLTAPVVIDRPVRLVGESESTVTILNTDAFDPSFSVEEVVTFSVSNVTITSTAGLAVAVDMAVSDCVLDLDSCVINASVRINGYLAAYVHARKTQFSPVTAVDCFKQTGGGILFYSTFSQCTFLGGTNTVFSCNMSTVTVEDCYITGDPVIYSTDASASFTDVNILRSYILCSSVVMLSTGTQAVARVEVSACTISASAQLASTALFMFGSTTILSTFRLTDSTITVSASTATMEATSAAIVSTLGDGAISNILIKNNKVTYPAGTTGILYWSDAVETTTSSVQIIGNTLFRGSEMVRLGSNAGQMTYGEYIITNNYHDNASSTDDAYGVRIFNRATPYRVVVSGNTFTNYSKASVGTRIGVDATWSSNSYQPSVEIYGNQFLSLGAVLAVKACGVYFGFIATSPQGGFVSVHDNRFAYLAGDTAAAVYIAVDAADNLIDFSIKSNSISYIGGSYLATVYAYGVFCSDVAKLLISDNDIKRVRSTSVAGCAHSIYLSNVGVTTTKQCTVTVARNRCCIAEATTLSTVAGSLIRLADYIRNVTIADNYLSQEDASTTYDMDQHIYVGTDALYSLNVTGNTIVGAHAYGSYFTTSGIYVVRSTTAAVQRDITISNNLVKMQSVAPWSAIRALLGSGASGFIVRGNTIREEGDAKASHTGIFVKGVSGNSRSVHICGNTLLGSKTLSGGAVASRIGIGVTSCMITRVSDNLIDWNEDAVASGDDILYDSLDATISAEHLITNNIINPQGGFGTSINLSDSGLSMQCGLINGNNMGYTGNAGTIFPLVAPATWKYGAAVSITEFNKAV